MKATALHRLPPLPPYVINGITVAIGIGLAQALVFAVGPAGAARAASAGAVYASLPHLVDRAGRAARRALAGGVIGSGTAALIGALGAFPSLVNASIALLVFGAMMMMAWGQRAGPISFTVVLAIVFSLATPREAPLFATLGWTLAGAVAYAAWAYVSGRLLEPRYRSLAIARALGSSARLLTSRADVLEARVHVETEATDRWRQVDEEAQLATLLQSARDLVFTERHARDRVDYAELLIRTTELRDHILTSRLDLDRLGEDDVAYAMRHRLAVSLRANAAALADVESALATGARVTLDRSRVSRAIADILDERGLPASDPRLRLLPAMASRQQHLIELIVAIHGIWQSGEHEPARARAELGPHVGDERWPVSELTRQLSFKSPIFRHALRSAVALSLAHALSLFLPWAAHPHWVVLSVAVVLRGTFAQTLSRRNDRIVGTAAGCLLALSLATFLPEAAIAPAVWLAAGTAHAFVNVRYKLTAVAASVMALLQTRTLQPIAVVLVFERLADTVAGAGLAWAFSYVLPSWSRRTLPELLETTLDALRTYSACAPSLAHEAPAEQRLARERAYGSLDAFISGVRWSRAEPARVRPPLAPLLSFIDHAQTLMAHLSSLRLMLLRRAEQLKGPETEMLLEQGRARLAKRLALETEPYSLPPPVQPLELELPSVPAERAPLPWLLRRLNVAIYEAEAAGEAARSALALLRTAQNTR